jgi:hypothetical protein
MTTAIEIPVAGPSFINQSGFLPETRMASDEQCRVR